MTDQIEKRGLYLEWDKSADQAITCLVQLANGSMTWQTWKQHETDTRGIVTERAAKALRDIMKPTLPKPEYEQQFCQCTVTGRDGDGVLCSKCGKNLF